MVSGILEIVSIIAGLSIGPQAVNRYLAGSILTLGGAYAFFSEKRDFHTTAVILGYTIAFDILIFHIDSVITGRFDMSLLLFVLSVFMTVCTYLLSKGQKYNTRRMLVIVGLMVGLQVVAALFLRVSNIPWKYILIQEPNAIPAFISFGLYMGLLMTPDLEISTYDTRMRRNADPLTPALITERGIGIDRDHVPFIIGTDDTLWRPVENPVTEMEAYIPLTGSERQGLTFFRKRGEDTVNISVVSLNGGVQSVPRLTLPLRTVFEEDGFLYIYGDGGVFVRLKIIEKDGCEELSEEIDREVSERTDA